MENMKRTGDCIRQGDVLLVRVGKDAVTAAHKPVQLDRGRVVLADGETSLHQHVVRGRGVSLLYAEGVSERVLTVGAELAQLVVEGGELAPGIERHGAIPVPPGTYRVVIQREWSGEEVRNVAD